MRMKAVLAIAMIALVCAGAWAEIEIGLGIAPPIGEVPEEATTGDVFGDSTKVVHAGYSFLWLFYASYDGLVLPPYSVSQMSGSIDTSSGAYIPGFYRPGFLNTFNVGIRPTIGPLSVIASVGINQMYVYKQEDDGLEIPPVGVNLRVGAGFRLTKWLGLTATGTSVFADFDELSATLDALTGDDTYLQDIAKERILSTLFPIVTLVIYL